MKNLWFGALGLAAIGWLTMPMQAQAACPGDCDGNKMVAINELVLCVNIALGAPLSTCMACDVDGNGEVTINELVQAVNAALDESICGGTGTGFCGDGTKNAGEDCDDGNNFGGDGCAANCTNEVMRVGTFDSDKTIAQVQTVGFAIRDLHLVGSQTFRTGKVRNSDTIGPNNKVVAKAGELPAVIKADELHFAPVKVLGALCACVRAIPAPDLFGPGVSGAGSVGCGTDGLTDVSYRLIQDHNTTPGDPGNKTQGTPDDPTCTAQNTLPGGTISKACKEQVDTDCKDVSLHPHQGVCNGPRQLTRSGGAAGKGSAFIVNNTAIAQLADSGTCDMTGPRAGGSCPYPDYGPDCLPCTADDKDFGIVNNLPTTTGTAESAVFDTNNGESTIDKAPASCGNAPCITSVSGANFDCDKLINDPDPNAGLSGGSLAVSFPALDANMIGDNVTTTVFFNK